jgi:hypothetical protein
VVNGKMTEEGKAARREVIDNNKSGSSDPSVGA